jgi:hypothetical protein
MKTVAPAVLAAALLVALSACERDAANGSTASTRLEGAVERTQEKLAAAGEKTQEAIGSASERLQPKIEAAGDCIADAAGKVTTTITSGERTAVTSGGEPLVSGDTVITASVKAGLLKDPDLSVLKIDVDTRDGVVTMGGVAESAEAKARATRIAEAVKGVKEVRNQVTVKGG